MFHCGWRPLNYASMYHFLTSQRTHFRNFDIAVSEMLASQPTDVWDEDQLKLFAATCDGEAARALTCALDRLIAAAAGLPTPVECNFIATILQGLKRLARLGTELRLPDSIYLWLGAKTSPSALSFVVDQETAWIPAAVLEVVPEGDWDTAAAALATWPDSALFALFKDSDPFELRGELRHLLIATYERMTNALDPTPLSNLDREMMRWGHPAPKAKAMRELQVRLSDATSEEDFDGVALWLGDLDSVWCASAAHATLHERLLRLHAGTGVGMRSRMGEQALRAAWRLTFTLCRREAGVWRGTTTARWSAEMTARCSRALAQIAETRDEATFVTRYLLRAASPDRLMAGLGATLFKLSPDTAGKFVENLIGDPAFTAVVREIVYLLAKRGKLQHASTLALAAIHSVDVMTKVIALEGLGAAAIRFTGDAALSDLCRSDSLMIRWRALAAKSYADPIVARDLYAEVQGAASEAQAAFGLLCLAATADPQCGAALYRAVATAAVSEDLRVPFSRAHTWPRTKCGWPFPSWAPLFTAACYGYMRLGVDGEEGLLGAYARCCQEHNHRMQSYLETYIAQRPARIALSPLFHAAEEDAIAVTLRLDDFWSDV